MFNQHQYLLQAFANFILQGSYIENYGISAFHALNLNISYYACSLFLGGQSNEIHCELLKDEHPPVQFYHFQYSFVYQGG